MRQSVQWEVAAGKSFSFLSSFSFFVVVVVVVVVVAVVACGEFWFSWLLIS